MCLARIWYLHVERLSHFDRSPIFQPNIVLWRTPFQSNLRHKRCVKKQYRERSERRKSQQYGFIKANQCIFNKPFFSITKFMSGDTSIFVWRIYRTCEFTFSPQIRWKMNPFLTLNSQWIAFNPFQITGIDSHFIGLRGIAAVIWCR